MKAEHPLAAIPDPFATEPIIFDRETVLQAPRFHRCECGAMTNNASRECDTCVKLDSDEFGRVEPERLPNVDYTPCDCEICSNIRWDDDMEEPEVEEAIRSVIRRSLWSIILTVVGGCVLMGVSAYLCGLYIDAHKVEASR